MSKRKSGLNIHGILLLDKRLGVSSNKALQEVRHLFNANKAGHTGSLDPLATGLLVILIGQSTKMFDKFVGFDKAYEATMKLGVKTVSADIQGKIISVLVDAGSSVRKGEALIQLDNSLLKLQLQTVEIQIEGLEADVKRYTVLADADAIQGVQLEKTILGLKSAKVQRANLLEQISKTTIVAPFSGIVTAKLTEEGAFAAPGLPLLQITDISSLKFTVNVPEQDLHQFEAKQQHALSADAYPETVFSGKVTMTGSKANVGNSFPVQFLRKLTSNN